MNIIIHTVRMVSYWISLLTKGKAFPSIISEAINQTKSDYYIAISETRDSHNDLTYFFIYLYDTAIKYILTYLNIEYISSKLKNENIVLTTLEKIYLKKIMISNKGKFTYNDFVNWIGVDMSKQGALKTLNFFVKYHVLIADTSNTNKKLFSINRSMTKYANQK